MQSRRIDAIDVLTQHSRQMLIIGDEKMIQTFLADASEESFTVRVHLWRAHSRFDDLDFGRCREALKPLSELAIPISKKNWGPSPNGVACRSC